MCNANPLSHLAWRAKQAPDARQRAGWLAEVAPGDGFEFDPDFVFDGNHCLEAFNSFNQQQFLEVPAATLITAVPSAFLNHTREADGIEMIWSG